MKRVPCPHCNKLYFQNGIGPHKSKCKSNPGISGVVVSTKKKRFEKSDDGLFHCDWCKTTSCAAQGIAAHVRNAHPEEFEKIKSDRSLRKAAAISLKGSPLSKMRAKMQMKVCGIDLTKVPLEKLPLVSRTAKQELEARYKELLGAF